MVGGRRKRQIPFALVVFVHHGQTEKDDRHRRMREGQWLLGLFRDVRIAHGLHLVDRVLLDQDVDADAEVDEKLHHLAGAPRVGRGRKAAQVGLPKGGLCERVTGQAALPRHISFTTKGGKSVLMMVSVRRQTTRVEDRDRHLLRSLFSCAMARAAFTTGHWSRAREISAKVTMTASMMKLCMCTMRKGSAPSGAQPPRAQPYPASRWR